MEIKLNRVANSRLPDLDFGELGFGDVFSDHMFVTEWIDGAWRNARIEPYGPIPVMPGSLTLHYGQSVFEGLKAYYGLVDEKVRCFRPDRNAERMQRSSQRLCIPEFGTTDFIEAISALVKVDKDWTPREKGQSLYIRPLTFATEDHLAVRPASRYMLVIMTAPVAEYFGASKTALTLKAEDRYTRAAPGGMGSAKTAGNYAASLLPSHEGRSAGYDQVLWLDGLEHRYIEEAGQMNIFFRINERVITPPLKGTILPGVTRDSVIQLLRDWGVSVEESPIAIDEAADAATSGELVEAFGAGTASVVVPVGGIVHQGERIDIPVPDDALSGRLYETILGIQHGLIEDPHGWTVAVA